MARYSGVTARKKASAGCDDVRIELGFADEKNQRGGEQGGPDRDERRANKKVIRRTKGFIERTWSGRLEGDHLVRMTELARDESVQLQEFGLPS